MVGMTVAVAAAIEEAVIENKGAKPNFKALGLRFGSLFFISLWLLFDFCGRM